VSCASICARAYIFAYSVLCVCSCICCTRICIHACMRTCLHVVHIRICIFFCLIHRDVKVKKAISNRLEAVAGLMHTQHRIATPHAHAASNRNATRLVLLAHTHVWVFEHLHSISTCRRKRESLRLSAFPYCLSTDLRFRMHVFFCANLDS